MKKVVIGPHEFKVIFNRTPVLEKVQQDHSDQYGYSDFDKLEIAIDDRCPTSRRKEVLLHEILHCIYWVYAIMIPVGSTGEEERKQMGATSEEERLIQQTTAPLMLVFRQNRGLFEWILEKDGNHASN